MAERRLVVAVEGTAALGRYWPAIVADYVEKIVWSFCARKLPGKEGATPELALVVFHTHEPHSAFCVQRSRWTKDVEAFLSWLSGIPFSGGGSSEASTCEGLAEALMILHGSRNTTKNSQNHEAHKHCLLVAASNPYPFPTPVYGLPIQSTGHKKNIESSKEPSIANAETVAKLFPQCSVSLSVISPKQLPTLNAIYNVGKGNPQAASPPVNHAKDPQFLVLLSENFVEARTALCHPSHGNLTPNQSIILKMASAFEVYMPGSTSNANPSVNGPMIDQKPVVGGISTATVKVEPTTILAMVSGGIGATGLGAAANNSVPAMMPTPWRAQQTGVSFLGVTSNFAINMSSVQHPNAQAPPYVKIWEGTLSGVRNGEHIFICKLEGYRSGATSETVAADWPATMQIFRLVYPEHVTNKDYAGKVDILVFRSFDRGGFIGQLKKKKLCAVIQLPSQTLFLSVSNRDDRLVGTLYHADVVVFPQPVSDQQPSVQLQQQIQQPQAPSSSSSHYTKKKRQQR